MLRVLGMLLALVLAMPLGCAQKPIKVGVPVHAAASFTIGPRTGIISAATLAGLGNWFWQDSGIGILNNGDGTYAFFASIGGSGHVGRPGKTVGTMANPLSVSALETTITGRLDAPDGTVAQTVYQGGGPVYKDPASGMLVMFSHQERHLNGAFPGTQYYAWLGILKSTDGGDTWVDCGAIITPHHSFDEMMALYDTFGKSDGTQYSANLGWGPYLIIDGYFYVYYFHVDAAIQDDNPAHGGGVYGDGTCVARALVADVVAAAAAGTVPVFYKYNAGTWTELGIRGTCTPVTPIEVYSYAMSYNTFRNKSIIVLAHEDTVGDSPDNKTFGYLESLDGIPWTNHQTVRIDLDRLPLHIYSSMVDPASLVPYETGQSFYLIAKNWDTGEVDRFLVTLTGDPTSSSSSPGGPP